MADPDSLWHQVQSLIALRQANPALQNRGGITFVSTGVPGTPLAYERFQAEQKLLVVINPSAKSAGFAYSGKLGAPLYTIGEAASQSGGTVTAAPVSAGIYQIG